MKLLNFIVIILLFIVLMKQIQYMRKLKIRTRKSVFEIITIIIGILVLITLTYFFAKSYIHYFIAFLGIALLIADWTKQGISDNGIFIVARGKEQYRWNEMENAKIKKGNFIIIDYYSRLGTKIISHIYRKKDINGILELFVRNNFKYEEVSVAK